MIDLENEMIQKLIEETKRTIEYEILRCFKCHIEALFLGEVKDGRYLININYMVKKNTYKLPEGFCITTNIDISEKDYKKYIKEVKERNETNTGVTGDRDL